MKPFIPVFRPRLPDAERLLPYLRRIDASRVYANWGPLTTELEQRLAQTFGLPQPAVVSACSGTAALVGAMLASAGRATSARPLAVVPALTFVATAIAIEQCGYRPYLVDVDPDDWSLDLDRLERHPLLHQIGLIVVVAPFGRPADQADCRSFRERTGISVVIDGGASFEAVSRNPRGTLGPIPTALSFHATKSFAMGEGGCVVTTDERLASDVARALNFGFESSRNSVAASINGKLSEYHAAVGLAELDEWAGKHDAFLRVAQHYRRAFAAAVRKHRLIVAPDVASCYALLEAESADAATQIRLHLEQSNVDTRLWYGEGLHGHDCYRDLPRDSVDVTQSLAPRLIGLPMACDLTADAIERVVATIVEAVAHE